MYGDSLKATLVAVVVPDEAALAAKYPGLSLEETCQKPDLMVEIMGEISRIGKPLLKGFEQVKKVHLHHELFSVENDLATPTFKKKRVIIAERFKTELDKLYEGLD